MRLAEKQKGLWIDPRTKILLLLLCVLSAVTAPSIRYEMLLVLLIALYGIACGRIRSSILGIFTYIIIYFVTIFSMQLDGGLQTMMIAFLGLVHKVYPCGMLSGIIISTTKVGEFMSAMNRIHVSQKIVIPLAVMLRYVPTIREDWDYIKDAMRMRDVSPSLKGFFMHPGMTIECIYVPLMMAASKTADELTVASITRGIETPKRRTSLVKIGFGAGDVVFTVAFLAVLLAGQCLEGVFL